MSDNSNQLPQDLHTHTHLCKHAEGTANDYVSAAVKKGMAGIACTDHCPSPHKYDPEHRMEMEDLDTYNIWVNEAKERTDIKVYKGIEADFYQGGQVFMEEFLKEEEFDVVLGSVHYQCFWADKISERTLWDGEDITAVWRRYFKMISLMVESKHYDVVAHIDLPKKRGQRPNDSDLAAIVLPALDQITLSGMAIEINTSGLIHPVAEMYPSPQILAWAKEREIPITFGSDAHTPDRVGADFDKAVAAAKAVGYTHYAVYENREQQLISL